ncbi:hypothetical protein ABXY91_002662 [Vibrio fluvialis]
MPGKPDIVMRKYKLCIFVNGCFWHHHLKCVRASIPKTNTEYWIKKFRRNQQRDRTAIKELKKLGWKVLVIWEYQTRKRQLLLKILANVLPINELTNNVT